MRYASRYLLMGVGIATALHWWIDPPLGVLLIAMYVGFAFGVVVSLASELFEKIDSEREGP